MIYLSHQTAQTDLSIHSHHHCQHYRGSSSRPKLGGSQLSAIQHLPHQHCQCHRHNFHHSHHNCHHCHPYRGSSRLGSQSQISASRLITPSAPSSNHGFNGASSHRAHHGVSHQKVVQDNGGSHDEGIPPLRNVVPLVTSNELKPDEQNIPGPFSPRFQVITLTMMIMMTLKFSFFLIMRFLGGSMGSRR